MSAPGHAANCNGHRRISSSPEATSEVLDAVQLVSDRPTNAHVRFTEEIVAARTTETMFRPMAGGTEKGILAVA
jgi:hypothetical protein